MHHQRPRQEVIDKWHSDLANCKNLKCRTLIVADVSASIKLAGAGSFLVEQMADVILNVRVKSKENLFIGIDWAGYWDQKLNLLYSSNPHGDFMPNSLKKVEGVYRWGDEHVSKETLAKWLTSFGVPRVNLCLPFNWAQERKLHYDAFLFITDEKTIINSVPDDAWNQYVNATGIQPRVANLCLKMQRLYTNDKGQTFDRLWQTPFFGNYTVDTLAEMWRFMNGK